MFENDLREQSIRQASRIQRLEEDLRALNSLVRIVDRDMPVMLAYLDRDERYAFHNHAYRRWLAKPAAQIEGHSMREVLGDGVYAAIAERIKRVLAGATVRYERSHTAANGEVTQISVHLIPRFDEQRLVTGFYSLAIDHTDCTDSGNTPPPHQASMDTTPRLIAPLDPADAAEDAPELFQGSVASELAEWKRASETIKSAIRNEEFRLYCQTIKDLAAEVPPFHGIFVRQAEEERNMMPPGAFFALAEEYGMMSELDRWVVSRVLSWASECQRVRPEWRPSMYCINLSRDTIADPYFPDFVHQQLTRNGVAAEVLCFEVQETDVIVLPADTTELIRNLRSAGSRTMLGGFGREKLSFEILKDLHFDFIKIDGSIILNVLRSESSVTKVRGIVRLGHTLGINIVAELVESDEIIAKLRELEVDYVQGYAVSGALPLSELGARPNGPQ